jgi:hypothetical protein
MPQKKEYSPLPSGWCECPIELLVKADWNYKTENYEKSKKLSRNIKKNGQMENLIIRDLQNGKYEIVNGNHRYDSLKANRFKTIFVFNTGVISLEKAKRIAVETNETKFSNDDSKLGEILASIEAEFGREDILLTMPFTEKQMDSMIEESNRMISELSGEIESFNPQEEGQDPGQKSEEVPEFESEPEGKSKPTGHFPERKRVFFVLSVDAEEDYIEDELQALQDEYPSLYLERR